jgi:hypothetical protein
MIRNSLKKRGLNPQNIGDKKVCAVDSYSFSIG